MITAPSIANDELGSASLRQLGREHLNVIAGFACLIQETGLPLHKSYARNIEVAAGRLLQLLLTQDPANSGE